MKGYGEQLTGGYSIQAEEVSESENAVFCKTRLIGPEKAAAFGTVAEKKRKIYGKVR